MILIVLGEITTASVGFAYREAIVSHYYNICKSFNFAQITKLFVLCPSKYFMCVADNSTYTDTENSSYNPCACSEA